jgi:CubicO group peptidase (beta-lactamase class C family)
MMKTVSVKFFLLFGILCCMFTFSLGQAQDKKVVLPDTPLGKIIEELFTVVNDGDDAMIINFVENRFSAAALKNQTAPGLTALLRNLKKQSGGAEILRVTPPTSEQPMYLTIKSKKGERFAQMTIGMNAKEGKLAGIGINKIENPAGQNWTQTLLSEKEMIAEIKRAIEIRAQNGDFSGAILIAKDDRILLNVAYGYADREAKILNTTKTQFHLASVGKMFTAAAIATLVKKGKISFTDTVGKLLPDFPNREIAEKVRVHHLLTHSAGLGTFFESPGFNPRKQYRTATEEVEVYKNEPLFFEPGAKMRYSNAGYSLLGAIIERVSGKTYLEYVRENVFKPLGMIDTGTNSVEVPATGGAVLYQPTDVDPFGLEPYNANRGILRSQPTGFGGGFSTSADLFKFARAYNTGKFLGQELTETMIAAKDGRNWGYGIVESKVNGETVRGHSGGGRADVAILWNSGYTVIVQTNATPPPAAALSSQIVRFITKQLSLRK